MESKYSFEFSVKTSDPRDRPIIATADDAILSKYAAVQAGYYVDPFIETFGLSAVGLAGKRRRPFPPIIKRGTFARVCVMDRAIKGFLQVSKTQKKDKVQIFVLGAGKDTSYFRLRQNIFSSAVAVDWIEVDHESLVTEKARILRSNPVFNAQSLRQSTPHCHVLDQGYCRYSIVAHDLRSDPRQLLEKVPVDRRIPTIVLLECVLMYLPQNQSNALLSWASEYFHDVTMCVYEPILGSDAFGRTMESNLRRAGVADPESGLVRTRTLSDYLKKFVDDCGFDAAIAWDMWKAYQYMLTNEQRGTANRCEMLDELEEFIMIMQHYCFLVATTSSSDVGKDLCSTAFDKSPLGFVANHTLVRRSN